MGGVNAPATIEVEAPAFTMARVHGYGMLTADLNPIHVDQDFAAASRFGRPIVHGLFVLAPVWEAVERAFGPVAMAGAESDLRFVAPTFVETVATYRVTLDSVTADRATYAILIADAVGVIAVTGTLTIAI